MIQPKPEIDEAILFIHAHLCDPLSLKQIARHVGYSPYHFIRLFKAQTGLTPQYYISSARLQKAKELLLQTNLTVRDVALEIGQQSIGTFTTRFADKVGVTPAHFRDQHILAETGLQSVLSESREPFSTEIGPTGAIISGRVNAESPIHGVIFIGLFLRPIPDAIPAYGTLLTSPGPFRFSNVKPGTYYLMATSVSSDMRSTDILLPHRTLRTRFHEPIVVASHHQRIDKEVALYPPSMGDPPILISLPLLMQRFMARQRFFLEKKCP
ncbi:AraC family transcriptional regulator [Paenibacillus sp. VCA1]|uniref:AraC family transcriptional regulator n=1 Tax=Paenibacillus sp. VCA1 TaxID=3039148 RepID=UPI002872626B|nr:AraC family transcriptional regulator [Paenibacillus sp. VCA1]MDR9856367.1 AraC family transcriptional regulator [Paenibacillus sp. VCA1]